MFIYVYIYLSQHEYLCMRCFDLVMINMHLWLTFSKDHFSKGLKKFALFSP